LTEYCDRHNKGKPDLSLIQYSLLKELAFALMEGEKVYSTDNWKKGLPWSQLFSAAQRHLWKAKDVEKYDKDAKHYRVRHLALAVANIMFMIYQEDVMIDKALKNPVD